MLPGGREATIEKEIFVSRTSKPISMKLSTNHPWVKGILNCSNKGTGPLQSGGMLSSILIVSKFVQNFVDYQD
jgi:hypothetical protein